jgi:hypothetical protein
VPYVACIVGAVVIAFFLSFLALTSFLLSFFKAAIFLQQECFIPQDDDQFNAYGTGLNYFYNLIFNATTSQLNLPARLQLQLKPIALKTVHKLGNRLDNGTLSRMASCRQTCGANFNFTSP